MTSLLPLPKNQMHVWLTHTEEAIEPALLAQYGDLLSAEERLQRSKFHDREDSHRYLITRALVRCVLSRYAALAPAQWTFERNAFGKPAIANAEVVADGLSFNVSHTRGLVALVVGRDMDLGVDLEHITPQPDLMDLAVATMKPKECGTLLTLPAEERLARFYQHWTLKEAYIKARGRGLDIPVTQVGFELSAIEHLAMYLDSALCDAPGHWNLWQIQPTDRHCMALCASRHGPEKQELRWWKTVPLKAEMAIHQAIARTSV